MHPDWTPACDWPNSLPRAGGPGAPDANEEGLAAAYEGMTAATAHLDYGSHPG